MASKSLNFSRDLIMKLQKLFILICWMVFSLPLSAAQMVDLKVFSEDDYLRVAFGLDESANAQVEANTEENLVFIRFDNTGINSMPKQSFLYADNPHLESVTLLPLGEGSTVARIKARHPFKIKTYEIPDPPRFVLELNDASAQAGNSERKAATGTVDYYRRGIENMQKGSYNSALMAFRSAIRSGNRVAESYYHAGVIRCKLEQYDKSLINFSRAAKSSIYGDETRLYLSWIHYKTGNYPAMRSAWRKFVESQPDPNRRLSVAGKHPEIDYRSLQAAMGMENGSEVSMGGSGTASGEIPRLETSESYTVSENRDSAAIYFENAMTLMTDNRLEQAARNLEDAVRCYPNYSQAYFQLGVIYKSLGKTELSAENFEKSLENHEEAGQTVGEKIGLKTVAKSTQALAGISRETLPSGESDKGMDLFSESEESGNGENVLLGSSGQSQDGGPDGLVNQAPEVGASLLGNARTTAAKMISLVHAGLFRKRVKLLTLITGILFLLTLLGEQIFLRKLFRRKAGVSGNTGQVVDVYRNRSSLAKTAPGAGTDRLGINRKREQVAEVLASELASIKQAKARSESDNIVGNSLKSNRPVGDSFSGHRINQAVTGGIYGADISRRIKGELTANEERDEHDRSTAFKFGSDRNDVKTKLIRQLRDKSWSISDIAQEMSLSREEVKWALSAESEKEPSEMVLSGGLRQPEYGQMRGLLESEKNSSNLKLEVEKIDHEADLELQINI
jgi:tetratricopeptide (TPR) repeat protein